MAAYQLPNDLVKMTDDSLDWDWISSGTSSPLNSLSSSPQSSFITSPTGSPNSFVPSPNSQHSQNDYLYNPPPLSTSHSCLPTSDDLFAHAFSQPQTDLDLLLQHVTSSDSSPASFMSAVPDDDDEDEDNNEYDDEERPEKKTRKRKRRKYVKQVIPETDIAIPREKLQKMSLNELYEYGESLRKDRQLREEHEMDLKRMERLIKNREAAKASRAKKKEVVDKKLSKLQVVQKENKTLRREKKALASRVETLEQENHRLREQLNQKTNLLSSFTNLLQIRPLPNSQVSKGLRGATVTLMVFLCIGFLFPFSSFPHTSRHAVNMDTFPEMTHNSPETEHEFDKFSYQAPNGPRLGRNLLSVDDDIVTQQVSELIFDESGLEAEALIEEMVEDAGGVGSVSADGNVRLFTFEGEFPSSNFQPEFENVETRFTDDDDRAPEQWNVQTYKNTTIDHELTSLVSDLMSSVPNTTFMACGQISDRISVEPVMDVERPQFLFAIDIGSDGSSMFDAMGDQIFCRLVRAPPAQGPRETHGIGQLPLAMQ